jgi:hypothetical protein
MVPRVLLDRAESSDRAAGREPELRPGVSRPPNGADSECEPRPRAGTTRAPDGADSDISARVTGHITAPAQHTYHVTAGPQHIHMHVLP